MSKDMKQDANLDFSHSVKFQLRVRAEGRRQ